MTAPKLRLFVAFDVPLELRRQLQDLIGPVRAGLEGGRWTRVESQHVTLKFLGWVPEEEVEAVAGVCRVVTSRHQRAHLNLGELGAFPNARRARVLWAGIEDPAGATSVLAEDLDAGFGGLGFSPEDRVFTPHLTLARFKTPVRLDDDWLALRPQRGSFECEEVVLYRSHMGRGGSKYEALLRFPLGGDG